MPELEKSYDPKKVEDKWYKFWEDNDFFKVDPESKKEPFCIIMPPPNVTGVLHMGHALNNTMQDIICRYRRNRTKYWQYCTRQCFRRNNHKVLESNSCYG